MKVIELLHMLNNLKRILKMGFREHFSDGSILYEVYVCILDFEVFNNSISVNSSRANLPLTIITIDRNKALDLKKSFGYEIYCTDLKSLIASPTDNCND